MKNRVDKEKKFWNAKAKKYDGVVNKFFPEIYEFVLTHLIHDTGKSEHLLEIATGTGIIAIKLSGHVSQITAIDIAPEMLRVAKEKCAKKQINNIDFKMGDACNLELEDKTFDTIVASNVLHLLFTPSLALEEMKRVLKDDGKIIVPTFCHGANLRSHILSRILGLFGQSTRSRWSKKSFKEFIEQNGFKIIKDSYIDAKIPLVYLVAIKK